MREGRVIVGIAAPIGDKKCLELALPPLPFTGRCSCLAATQLRPANDEERQLHRRTHARESGGSKLTKRYALRIIVPHNAVSSLCSTWRRVTARASCEKEKEPPMRTGG